MFNQNIGHFFSLLLLLVVSILSFIFFVYLLPRLRQNKGALFLCLTQLAVSLWSGLYVLELLEPDMAIKILLANIEYLGIVSLAPLILLFTLSQFSSRQSWSTTDFFVRYWYLFIVPLLTSILVWFDPVLGWVRYDFTVQDMGLVSDLHKHFGFWFWIHALYSYGLLVLASSQTLVIAFREKSQRLGKHLLFIGAVAVPWLVNMGYLLDLPIQLFTHDLTPVAFFFSITILMISVVRFRFMDLIPLDSHPFIRELEAPLLYVDQLGRLASFNLSCGQLLGLPEKQLGVPWREVLRDNPTLSALLHHDLSILTLTQNAEIRYFEIHRKPLEIQQKPVGQLWSFVDVTDRQRAQEALQTMNGDLEEKVAQRTRELEDLNQKLREELEVRRETEKQLFYYSLHDPLTGLPNRSMLLNRLELALGRHKRDPSQIYGLLFLDFDGFKQINDSWGHSAGDHFLKEMTARILKVIREVDTAARFGSDQFSVLLEGVHSLDEAQEIVARLTSSLTNPIRLGAHQVFPSVSVGIVMADPHYKSPNEVILDADIALYRAKEGGRGRHILFEKSMRTVLQDRLGLLRELGRGIVVGEIKLRMQPVVDLLTGAPLGFEVLCRWHHPERGVLSPDLFIPLAEESGMIVPLGTQILRQACMQAKLLKGAWQGKGAFMMAVNISATQLIQADFPETVDTILKQEGFPAHELYFELTENSLIKNSSEVLPAMEALRALGIRFELDDFGTGYSSLSYLQKYPLDIIKIDKSFVQDMESGPSRGIVKTIITLGHELGLKLVAEGIEDEEQWEILKSFGCEYGQGYLFARPLEGEELDAYIRKQRSEEGVLPASPKP